MPYADPEKQKEAQARWYRQKYKTDRKFRQRESDRKAEWLQTEEGKESNAEASARARKAATSKAPKSKAKARARAA
jgi:hypothetical protein